MEDASLELGDSQVQGETFNESYDEDGQPIEEGQEDSYEQDEYYQQQQSKERYANSDDDEEKSFDGDFDIIKEIRKQVISILNHERNHLDLNPFYIDPTSNNMANEYSQFLKDNPHDPAIFTQLQEQHRSYGDHQLMQAICSFEEGEPINADTTLETFKELIYVLLESQEEAAILLDEKYNQIGLGITATDRFVVIVVIVSQKILTIGKISADSENNLQVEGKMLNSKFGIYALRVFNSVSQKDMVAPVGPEAISFDRITKKFVITVPYQNPFAPGQKKLIELFIRANPDSIPYKKIIREKLNLKHVELVTRIPCAIFPNSLIDDDADFVDQQTQQEEEKKKQEAEKKARQANEEAEKKAYLEKQQQEVVENEQSDQDKDEQDENDEEDEVENQRRLLEIEQNKEAISNKEIREELEIAISEASKQHSELSLQNEQLQEKIKTLKNRNEGFLEKQGDVAMNEHKYLNTLAHVHQIRLDLKQTQDRYNKMAYDLQIKLEEKQKKCNEIKIAFIELKREVAKKAAFSRTDRPISEKQIDQWEEREIEKNKYLQELRLEILRLRNNLTKNQKILKKKEELAEGLHLIDFEQLKIENQTLNEKIEERNEDLHKLKKKNTNTVQILTHTREKLGFVQSTNETLESKGQEKEKELSKLRELLSELKREKDRLRYENMTLKQQTGIVNSEALTKDFESRKDSLITLAEQKLQLQTQFEKMQALVDQYKALHANKTKQSVKQGNSQINQIQHMALN